MPNNENVVRPQNIIIDKIKLFLKNNGRSLPLSDGYCWSLAAVWLYKKSQGQEEWLHNLLRKIAACPDDEIDKIEIEIEKLLGAICFIQKTCSLEVSLEGIDDSGNVKKIQKKFSFCYGVTKEELIYILNKTIKEHNFNLITADGHAIGVYKENNRFYLYDANAFYGEKAFDSIDALASEVIHCLNKNLKHNSDDLLLELDIYSNPFTKNDELFPTQSDLLTSRPFYYNDENNINTSFRKSNILKRNIERDDFNSVKKILEKKANVDLKIDGEPTVFSAKKNNAIFELLKSFNVNLDVRDKTNKSLLVHVASCGTLDCLKTVIDELDVINREEINQAFVSAAANSLQIVEYLYPKLSASSTLKLGSEALQNAVRVGHVAVIIFLLSHSSLLAIEIDDIKKALKDACRHESHMVFNLLHYVLTKNNKLNKKDLNDAFCEASAGGHFPLLKKLLDLGADINFKGNHAETPFIKAASNNHIDILKFLYEEKLRNTSVDREELNIALLEALKNDAIATAKFLLLINTDINYKSSKNETPIIAAASGASVFVLKHLLTYDKIDISVLDDQGRSAFYFAMINKKLEAAALLWKKCIDKKLPIPPCLDVLSRCAQSGYLNEVKFLLLIRNELKIPQKELDEALSLAAKEGHLEIVRALLNIGVSLNVKNAQDKTVLEIATENKRTEVVKFLQSCLLSLNNALCNAAFNGDLARVKQLVDLGANLNFKDNSGYTALSRAASKNHLKIIEFLFEEKLKNNAVDQIELNIALFEAIKADSITTTRFLLSNGADINYKFCTETPILVATRCASTSLIVQLLTYDNIDIATLDDSNNSAFYYLITRNELSLAKLLWNKIIENKLPIPPCLDVLSECAGSGYTEAVKFLLSIKNELKIPQEEEELDVALFLASKIGYTEIVKDLLNAGASVATKFQGKTALAVATVKNRTEVVKLLQSTLLNLNNALRNAAYLGDLAEVKKLLKLGADINYKFNNATPFIYAACNNYLDVVGFLYEEKLKNKSVDQNELNIALRRAIRNDAIDVTKFLLANGADINYQSNKNKTPIRVAARNASTRLIEYLLSCDNIDIAALDDVGQSVFYFAITKGRLAAAELLWKKIIEKKLLIPSCLGALPFCAQSGDIKKVKFLLSIKNELKISEEELEMALYLAAKAGHFEIVEDLLDSGASVIHSQVNLAEKINQINNANSQRFFVNPEQSVKSLTASTKVSLNL